MTQHERLVILARFATTFDKPGFRFAEFNPPVTLPDGVTQLGSWGLTDVALAFCQACYDANWVTSFDWTTWAQTPEGRQLTTTPTAIAKATGRQLQKLLTAIIRSDRFCDGALAQAYDQGVLTAAVCRAKDLLAQSDKPA